MDERGGTLGALDVYLVDCQATGARSAGGQLIEIGWARARACDWKRGRPLDSRTCLVRLPRGVELNARVRRVTGIRPDDLAAAPEPRQVWCDLLEALAGDGPVPLGGRPAVIHFARFELPFLQRLHGDTAPNTPFPLQVVCTHEIVRRLLPGLPRRGLRAAAGYFGHGVPEARRCGAHLAATAAVWTACVDLLETEHGVGSLDGLRRWMAAVEPSALSQRFFPMPRERRLTLPDSPGVYRMRRANHDLLYVGKATRLKQRVGSYFHRGRRHPEHILEMLTQARDVDVTETGSALEAALLESDEIKAFAPPYNRSLNNGQRRPAFCSRDFSSQLDCPDDHHRLGPLPGPTDAAAMAEAVGLIAARRVGAHHRSVAAGGLLFGFSPDRGPDEGCLALGLDAFWESHRAVLEGRPPARALLALGARLWRERMNAAVEICAEAPDDDDSDGPEAGSTAREWTPESVAGFLEGAVCRGAALIRRGRWLCLLSESSVSWERGKAGGKCLRELTFAGGAVVSRATRCRGAAMPAPPGWADSFRRRQRNFDAATYDRLRILTTELRRLLCQGRLPVVCVGPGRVIGPQRLGRGLAWI